MVSATRFGQLEDPKRNTNNVVLILQIGKQKVEKSGQEATGYHLLIKQ